MKNDGETIVSAEELARAVETRTFRSLAEFAAGAGHELNNPLAVISMLAQTLLRDETASDKRRMLAAIVEQTQVGYEMLASLRSFARPPQPALRPLNAYDFFSERFERERVLLAESGIETKAINSLDPSVSFDGDPEFLATILHSLARNATTAVQTRTSGKIHFIAEHTQNAIVFGVEDNGVGMTDEQRELAFAPYFSGRRAGRGLGVGLSLARRFAESLGAELLCEESQRFPTGCLWRVLVPLADEKSGL